MSKYYDKTNDIIKITEWEIDKIDNIILTKIMTKSNKTESENVTFKKYFQYYDKFKCGYISFDSFIQSIERLGIFSEDSRDKYHKYFKNHSEGKEYLNYNNLYIKINNKYIIKDDNKSDSDLPFSTQYENKNKNKYFHRTTSSNMYF